MAGEGTPSDVGVRRASQRRGYMSWRAASREHADVKTGGEKEPAGVKTGGGKEPAGVKTGGGKEPAVLEEGGAGQWGWEK